MKWCRRVNTEKEKNRRKFKEKKSKQEMQQTMAEESNANEFAPLLENQLELC